MMGYRERFKAMTDGLGKNPRVEIIKLAFGQPASDADIRQATRLADGRLPSGVEDFYKEMNGFSLEWEHSVEAIRQHDYSDRGFIEILPIPRVFGEWQGTIWFRDLEGGETYRPVKPLDYFQPEACAAFYQRADGIPDNSVYYHYLGEYLESTHYTFPEYIDRLLESRGYFYWIVTLCSGLQHTREASSFRRNMPLLFEDFREELFCPGRQGTSAVNVQ